MPGSSSGARRVRASAGMIDSHCHLNDERFDGDFEAVVRRAHEAGVRRALVVGYGLVSSRRAVTLAQDSSLQVLLPLSAVVGISNHESESWSSLAASEIRELLEASCVVGLGETGLDYFYPTPGHEQQQRCLTEQLEIAMESNLPVVFHLRDAEEDFFRILDQVGFKGKGVLHCFTGSKATMEEGIRRGLYVSFSGIVTFKKGADLLEVAAQTPLDRLLVETDCPYLAPEPHRGKRCEPSHVIHTARKIAERRGISYAELETRVEENLESLFPPS